MIAIKPDMVTTLPFDSSNMIVINCNHNFDCLGCKGQMLLSCATKKPSFLTILLGDMSPRIDMSSTY